MIKYERIEDEDYRFGLVCRCDKCGGELDEDDLLYRVDSGAMYCADCFLDYSEHESVETLLMRAAETILPGDRRTANLHFPF